MLEEQAARLEVNATASGQRAAFAARPRRWQRMELRHPSFFVYVTEPLGSPFRPSGRRVQVAARSSKLAKAFVGSAMSSSRSTSPCPLFDQDVRIGTLTDVLPRRSASVNASGRGSAGAGRRAWHPHRSSGFASHGNGAMQPKLMHVSSVGACAVRPAREKLNRAHFRRETRLQCTVAGHMRLE